MLQRQLNNASSPTHKANVSSSAHNVMLHRQLINASSSAHNGNASLPAH